MLYAQGKAGWHSTITCTSGWCSDLYSKQWSMLQYSDGNCRVMQCCIIHSTGIWCTAAQWIMVQLTDVDCKVVQWGINQSSGIWCSAAEYGAGQRHMAQCCNLGCTVVQ